MLLILDDAQLGVVKAPGGIALKISGIEPLPDVLIPVAEETADELCDAIKEKLGKKVNIYHEPDMSKIARSGDD